MLGTYDLGPETPPAFVNATALAQEAGIRSPVFLTRAVWDQYVQVPEGVIAQDETGRLGDILWMYRWHSQRARGRVLPFTVMGRNDTRRPRRARRTAVCGPGDTPGPVVTIRCPEER